MQQFTGEELRRIKEHGVTTSQLIAELIADNSVVLNHPLLVPESGVATWNLYYYCPEHALRLEWRRNLPTEHRCPVDGKVFRGEPYDGAWWRGLNGLNSKACYQLGILWLLTNEQLYLQKVRDLLLTYARYYPDYAEHGGIPYNGPGKANAQTLCEANCHLDFALGYDLIRNELSTEDQHSIEQRLLRPGAEFLMRHRHNQLHNHEVKISSTIGVIGLLLNEPDYVEFAVNAKYGLRYQLQHGVLPGGMWFEGSLHYHFYALQGFLAYEKLARHTQYSLLNLAGYPAMLSLPLKLLLPNQNFPRLNDCIFGQEAFTHSDIYEFAYSYYRDPEYAAALQIIYQNKSSENWDAVAYGIDDARARLARNSFFITGAELSVLLPSIPRRESYHSATVGVTLLRNQARQRAVLLKHAPFGGEHDHHDSLSLSLFERGIEIFPDMGTTGYGSKLHRGYYKNTATHNTICINQQNQPPAQPVVLAWLQTEEYEYLATQVAWIQPPPPLDSLIMCEWDDVAYQGVVFCRQILLFGDVLIDISHVLNPHEQRVSWNLHIDGVLSHSKAEMSAHEVGHYIFTTAVGELPIYLYGNGTLNHGVTPANPATRNLSFLALQSQQVEIVLCAVYNLNPLLPLDKTFVAISAEQLELNLEHNHQHLQLKFSLAKQLQSPLIFVKEPK